MRLKQQSHGKQASLKSDAYPNTTEWVSPLSSSYGLLQRERREGKEGLSLSISLMKWTQQGGGVPRDKDNNSICGAGGGLKTSRGIRSRYIFVCLWRRLCTERERAEEKQIELEEVVLAARKKKLFPLHQSRVAFCHHQGDSQSAVMRVASLKATIIKRFVIFLLGISAVPDCWTLMRVMEACAFIAFPPLSFVTRLYFQGLNEASFPFRKPLLSLSAFLRHASYLLKIKENTCAAFILGYYITLQDRASQNKALCVVTGDDPKHDKSILSWAQAKKATVTRRDGGWEGGERKEIERERQRGEEKKGRVKHAKRKQTFSFLSLQREHNLQSISDSEMRSSFFDWFRL